MSGGGERELAIHQEAEELAGEVLIFGSGLVPVLRCGLGRVDWRQRWGWSSVVGGTDSGSLFLRFFFSVANTLNISSFSDSGSLSGSLSSVAVSCSMHDSTSSSNRLARETRAGETCGGDSRVNATCAAEAEVGGGWAASQASMLACSPRPMPSLGTGSPFGRKILTFRRMARPART